ncbi:hypothetical protein ACQXVK_03955 [Curtobacterium sp. AB451]|uniref:hypothetical protein n=1 Tax=unclassified Curtobacterium TaxID=257496 RepID=UPI0038191159
MDVERVAAELVDRADERGQGVLRTDASTPIGELRAAVRAVARSRGTRIRTGMVDDVLAVVTVGAALWQATVSEMRSELIAPALANTVG